ncbi:rhomboid family intramembrane serine protease [soil metagenome]
MIPISDEKVPGRGLGLVTILFLVINVIVFVALQLPNDSFTYGYSVVPQEITTGQDLIEPQVIEVDGQSVAIDQAPGPKPIFLTLLTSMFMHGGWAHLLGNMLFLWIFGDNVEHTMSRGIYVIFYVIAGLVGAFAQILIDPDSVIPSLGASGAISGVLGAYLVLFPRNQVKVFMGQFLRSVPAIVVIGLWAVFQFINGFGSIAVSEQTTGGVAYMAHIGGFVVGLIGGIIARATGAGRRLSEKTAPV